MANTKKLLSKRQIIFLQKVLEGGHNKISDTLSMLTGQEVQQLSVRSRITDEVNLKEMIAQMDFGEAPVGSVISRARGDFVGTLAFLQSQRDLEVLGHIMGHSLTGTKRSKVNRHSVQLQPDWTFEQSRKILEKQELMVQMLDTIGEIANILFGNYLATFQDKFKLATFQSVPSTNMVDDPFALLMRTVPWNSRKDTVVFTNQIDFAINQRAIRVWLLLVPDADGLQKMIEYMDNYASLKKRRESWTPSIVVNTLSGKQSRVFTGHLINPRCNE